MRHRPTAPLRVIVAERQALIRLDLVEMLASRGYQVIAQSDNIDETAILAVLLQPDLVIVDQDLRRTDTMHPMRRLQRSQFRLAMIETIARTTIVTGAETTERGVRICKPFDENDLFEAVDQALRVADSRDTGSVDTVSAPRPRTRRRSRASVQSPVDQTDVEPAGPEPVSIAG